MVSAPQRTMNEASQMQDRVRAALDRLVGLPLLESNRALDMQMFSFGARRTTTIRFGPRKGEAASVGQYGLHLQCAWRIAGPSGLVVGSRDVLSWTGTGPEPDDWDWCKGPNRRDEAIREWLAGSYMVEAITTDSLGAFTLQLSGSYALAVFPDACGDTEQWRLLLRDEERHFVVTGDGIED